MIRRDLGGDFRNSVLTKYRADFRKFGLDIRALVSGLSNAICWYVLASKPQNPPLPNLSILKVFTIVLQYHRKFMMVL